MPLIRSLDELHHSFQPLVEQFMTNCHGRGIELLVVETRRTNLVSDAYYAQGRFNVTAIDALRVSAGLPPLRTPADYAKKITKAGAYMSWHNYGLAVDIVPILHGVVDWTYNPEDPADFYDEMADEATKLGMTWGGSFRSFDGPHVEWHPGWTISGAAAVYRAQEQAKLDKPWSLPNT